MQLYAGSLILSGFYRGAVLAVDNPVAILALSWSPNAFNARFIGETGTLKCDVNEASKEDLTCKYA